MLPILPNFCIWPLATVKVKLLFKLPIVIPPDNNSNFLLETFSLFKLPAIKKCYKKRQFLNTRLNLFDY